MTRRVLLAAGGLVAVAAVAVATATGGAEGDDPPRRASDSALAAVTRGPLSAQVDEAGTLGYAAGPDGVPHSIVNQAAGAYTTLPRSGATVRCGRELYRVDDVPVALLCGRTPMYRSLSEGLSGPDVRVLNRTLAQAGYADVDPESEEFDSETTAGVLRLQEELGVDETGTIELGQAVALPGPLRIGKVGAVLGTMARPGVPLGQATSTSRQVSVDLSPSQASGVKAGDRANVTLPDNRSTPGVVTSVGTVANDGEGGPTMPVFVRPTKPKQLRGFDDAPVQVQITTAGVKDALSVPVTALLASSGGGYAVETAGGETVPVELGMFDPAEGRVQVAESRLKAGQRVVVPAT